MQIIEWQDKSESHQIISRYGDVIGAFVTRRMASVKLVDDWPYLPWDIFPLWGQEYTIVRVTRSNGDGMVELELEHQGGRRAV